MNGRQTKPEAQGVVLRVQPKPKKTEAQKRLEALEDALMDVLTARQEWAAATEEILDGTRGATTQLVIDARKRLSKASNGNARMPKVWQEFKALEILLRSYREAETF